MHEHVVLQVVKETPAFQLPGLVDSVSCSLLDERQMLVRTDSSAVVAYINYMGGSRRMWQRAVAFTAASGKIETQPWSS